MMTDMTKKQLYHRDAIITMPWTSFYSTMNEEEDDEMEMEMVSLVNNQEDDAEYGEFMNDKTTGDDDETEAHHARRSKRHEKHNVTSPSSRPSSLSTATAPKRNYFWVVLIGMGLLLLLREVFPSLVSSSSSSSQSSSVVSDDKQDDNSSSSYIWMHAVRGNTKKLYKVSRIAATQIEHYRNGTGLILNIHITHHAGTTMCRVIGRAPDTDGAPAISCIMVAEDRRNNITDLESLSKPWRGRQPWTYNETAMRIAQLRKYFHFVSWESVADGGPKKVPLASTNYEDPNLVSIYVTRDPLSRLLAGDAWAHYHFPTIRHGDPHNASLLPAWWEYAKGKRNVDNFALAVLAGNKCCNGSSTDPSHLEFAKTNVVDRFTFVLDIACLDDGMKAVADLLGFTPNFRRRKSPKDPTGEKEEKNDKGGTSNNGTRARHLAQNHFHAPPSERIPPGVYEYLVDKNRLSIELHEYAVSRSLVNCTALKMSREAANTP